ncbi:hypothetical protein SADUNF_Sadunf08G0025200 [Salix dunnii]|uniref:Uncharacterized protein n=1 Tax=Salix dunnii TaxID=1413687 RepID=A0A835JSL3_9ROSI|nr:hypothetical protein SADUNF_Sadunf08G0025200 [Salix dunnii]
MSCRSSMSSRAILFKASSPLLFNLTNKPLGAPLTLNDVKCRMSSPTLFIMAFLYLILLLLSPPPTSVGTDSMAGVAAATRPLESPSYETLEPKTNHGQQEFHDREVQNCLPKGFHPNSAPSRYINYHTLGSTMCAPSKHVDAP